MTTFRKISLIELLNNPNKYLGEPVEVEGELIYIGKSPRIQVYSVNLPEEEYCIGLLRDLRDKDKQLLCFGLENICLDEYNEMRVVVRGFFIKLHDNYAIKATEITSKQNSD